eukprot:245389-Prorocentrum_minimum.AAC.2
MGYVTHGGEACDLALLTDGAEGGAVPGTQRPRGASRVAARLRALSWCRTEPRRYTCVTLARASSPRGGAGGERGKSRLPTRRACESPHGGGEALGRGAGKERPCGP